MRPFYQDPEYSLKYTSILILTGETSCKWNFKGEAGGLGETVESILLSSCGPSSLTQMLDTTTDTPSIDQMTAIPNTKNRNWVADTLWQQMSDALGG